MITIVLVIKMIINVVIIILMTITIPALGCSICCVLRGSEAFGGGSASKCPSAPGGSAKEGLHVRRGSELASYELRSELEVELGPYEIKGRGIV